jgi:hypothetical protein
MGDASRLVTLVTRLNPDESGRYEREARQKKKAFETAKDRFERHSRSAMVSAGQRSPPQLRWNSNAFGAPMRQNS